MPRETVGMAVAAENTQHHNPVYEDPAGFVISVRKETRQLRITNPTLYPYTIAPYCHEFQAAFKAADLAPGLYLAHSDLIPCTSPSLSVCHDSTIETTFIIPPNTEFDYTATSNLFYPKNPRVIFYDGSVGILKDDDENVRIVNQTDQVLNIHPRWPEVHTLKSLAQGVYEAIHGPDLRFRTMLIGPHGLESHVHIRAKSVLAFRYRRELPEINRVAVVPLGDRCAVRLLLRKLEYTGPLFPFDLVRTTNTTDIVDIMDAGFSDMWNPELLDYSAEAGRIFHRNWSGLSFAHEVQDHEKPESDMTPIYNRMSTRYSARAERFRYTLQTCDDVLFVRTGIADRNSTINLVEALAKHRRGKRFRVLLLSAQPTDELANLDRVLHYPVEFNPDRMCADEGHFMQCAALMRGILDELGVSEKNLFWCPSHPRTSSKT